MAVEVIGCRDARNFGNEREELSYADDGSRWNVLADQVRRAERAIGDRQDGCADSPRGRGLCVVERWNPHMADPIRRCLETVDAGTYL